MKHTTFNARTDIDWDGGTVWVQNAALLKVVERCAASGHLVVKRHDGHEYTEDESVLLQKYFFILNEKALKPKYDPKRSFCLSTDMTVEVDDNLMKLKSGSAILCSESGEISLVEAADFARDYQAVAEPGHRLRPKVPFPDASDRFSMVGD